MVVVGLDATPAGDAALGRILAGVDARRDLVLVVAPAARRAAAQLTVFAAAGPGFAPGLARSATTRRAGYVTLPDVGVTVLAALGVGVPDSMNATAITSAGGAPLDAAGVGRLVDANTTAVFRDRAVGPVSVTFVVVQVLGYFAALASVAQGRRWCEGRLWSPDW